MYKPSTIVYILLLLLCFSSCKERHTVATKEIVETPEEISVRAEDIIKGTLSDLAENKKLPDSLQFKNVAVLQGLYESNAYKPLWSDTGMFRSKGDSLFQLLDSAYYLGLFPEHYQASRLGALRKELLEDTSSKLDASRWAYCDLLLSSAFVQLVKDLSRGRLLPDSVIARDSALTPQFFAALLKVFRDSTSDAFARSLEPRHEGYLDLRASLQEFVPRASFKKYTLVRTKDSSQIPALVYQRLREVDSLILDPVDEPDSLEVARAVSRYQKRRKLKVDGKISSALISRLNSTDRERFTRIVINMDRYKSIPPLPEQYIWVNIPSYQLQLSDSDSVVLESRVVVGKPETKTPVLNSVITDMITYPKWHIPESIIKKDILPGLKRDPGYTKKKGYSLIDKDGNEIDPYTVKWSKFKEMIPYKVVQGSGDENALGVMKFNFPNKFAVYLHDTNQRYLFSKNSRALSHGCVRVQAWKELAEYFIRNDSTHTGKFLPVDSLNSWLTQKQKHVIPVRKRVPLFIRYFTCEVKEGDLVFYDDIYGEDGRLRDKYFSFK